MSVTEMEHVLLLSDDIDQTCDFYRTVVGLRVGTRPPLQFPGYWLYAGDVPCLHIAERGSYRVHAARIGLSVPEDPGGTGPVDHIAFGADDYDELSARLERSGVAAIRNTVPGGGPRQLFIEDPDGVRVEINVKQNPNEAR
jgi:catechol 2,3-dioxygenase-like lactoylglutathione lyase family enzyme